MARRIAMSFPAAAGLTGPGHAQGVTDWDTLRAGANQAMAVSSIRNAFTSSYTGVIVDEFQDCSRSQVALIRTIAQYIPTVILGDPLQAIYEFDADRLGWSERLEGHDQIGSLDVPWRWTSNVELGSWLLRCRHSLERGEPILVGASTPVEVVYLEKAATQGGLSNVLRKLPVPIAVITGESQIGVRMAHIARGHRWDACEVFEKAVPDELLTLSRDHSAATSPDEHAQAILRFAKSCMSHVSKVSGVTSCESNLKARKSAGSSKAPIAHALRAVLAHPSGERAAAVLRVLSSDPETYIYRPQLLRSCFRTYTQVAGEGVERFADFLPIVLETRKHIDDPAGGPVVGTPLRLKGLEFESVVIVDPHRFATVEQLYVAISRPRHRLVVAIEPGETLGAWMAL